MTKIAITTRTEFLGNQNKTYVNTSYLEAFKNLNVDLFIMPHTNIDHEQMAELFDGLVVTGGYDIDPVLYHQTNRKSTGINIVEDENDLQLIKAFAEKKKPILGICRGLQAVNVAFGGSLIQDIPSEHTSKTTVNHQGENHKITFSNDSKLKTIMKEYNETNSFHHQGIHQLAEGFVVECSSDDGLIEAISKNNILAVQWHPERMVDIPAHLAIFEYFVSLCK
jgi:Predicted glutamine amidotransferases